MSHVLITGGTGLLGEAFVKGFMSKGFDVTFTTTSQEKGESLKSTFSDDVAKKLDFRVIKFTAESNIKEFLNSERNQNYSHLINNARTLKGLKVDEYGVANESSLNAEFFMAVTLPYMLSIGLMSSLESIVNITSMYGVVPPNKNLYEDGYKSNPIQYGVAKAAQIHLTKELSVRLADNNIKVNSLSLGGIEGRVDEAFQKRYASLCPSGRMLNIKEVFSPLWFLASGESNGMTGHNLIVDGGWSVW